MAPAAFSKIGEGESQCRLCTIHFRGLHEDGPAETAGGFPTPVTLCYDQAAMKRVTVSF